MVPEGKDVQPLLVPGGPKGIRNSSDLATVFLEDLCCPCTHIAKTLQGILPCSLPGYNIQSGKWLPGVAFAAGK